MLTITPLLLDINFTKGRASHRPRAIVLHVAQGTRDGTISHFRTPASASHEPVSAHYLVTLTGEVIQFVADEDTAWGNGILNRPDLTHPLVKEWANTPKDPSWPAGLPNLESISIEREGWSGGTIPVAQWAAERELIGLLCQRHGLPPDRSAIIGHYQLDSVSRAGCPGFDAATWSKLIGAVAMIVMPAPAYDVGPGLKAALTAAGDTAQGDEHYLKAADGEDALSVVAGGRGLYVWVPDSKRTAFLPYL